MMVECRVQIKLKFLLLLKHTPATHTEKERTFMELAIGNTVSGSIAPSGKLRKACTSFSKGNLT